MGFPRSRTVDPTACAVYHCVSRCARRLFLIADSVSADWIVRQEQFGHPLPEYLLDKSAQHGQLGPSPRLSLTADAVPPPQPPTSPVTPTAGFHGAAVWTPTS